MSAELMTGLFDNHLAADHFLPALVGQGALLAGWQVNPNCLIERKRIALVQARKQDFLHTRLVGLSGHDERDRLPRWNLHVRRLKTSVRYVDVNFP